MVLNRWLLVAVFNVYLLVLGMAQSCAPERHVQLALDQQSRWHAQTTCDDPDRLPCTNARWEFAPPAHATAQGVAPRLIAIESPLERGYNIFWTREPQFADLRLRVRLQARSGLVDRGGGLIWRVQNKDNYYICRYNPLEDNFRLYKVVHGVRTMLASIPIPKPYPDASGDSPWHDIEVVHVGTVIHCTFDATHRLDASDDTFLTQGGVGVWTKADAITWFDSFHAQTASPAATTR